MTNPANDTLEKLRGEVKKAVTQLENNDTPAAIATLKAAV